MGVRGGVLAAVGAIGTLIGVLLLVLRKGPFAAMLIVLLMSAAVFVVSVVQALIQKRR
jgi:hypothetical protein